MSPPAHSRLRDRCRHRQLTPLPFTESSDSWALCLALHVQGLVNSHDTGEQT